MGKLEIVWQWDPNEAPLEAYGTRPGPFQATPVMIDNVLYLSTMYTRVAALDAETGAELWVFDPRAYEGGPRGAGPSGFKHRGIAYWRNGKRRAHLPQQPRPAVRRQRRNRGVGHALRGRRQRLADRGPRPAGHPLRIRPDVAARVWCSRTW